MQALLKESLSTAEAGPQLPWYEWYPSDFSGNYIVQAMTVAQELGYRRLLDAAWTSRTPCFLPNNAQFLAAVARMSELQWGSDGRIVLEMFAVTQDGNYIYHPKQYDIYQRSRKLWEARHRGGKSRQEQKHDSSTPTSTPTSTPEADPLPVHSITTTTTTTTKTTGGRGDRIEAARLLFIELGIPGGKALIDAAASSIEILQADNAMTVEAAATWLLGQMRDYQALKNKQWSLLMFLQEGHWKDEPRTWERNSAANRPNDRKSPARERADRILEADKRVGAAIQGRIAEVAAIDPARVDRGGAVDLGGGVVLLPDRGGRRNG